MELTPEQQDQVRKAKAEGQRRVTLNFTPQQRSAWAASVNQELAGKEENIAHLRKIQAAERQSGFFGDVRRAITLSRRPVHDLAAEIGIECRPLSDFRAGNADLPPAALIGSRIKLVVFDNPKVSPKKILQPDIDATRERIGQFDLVFLVQDTTELDLTRPKQVNGVLTLSNDHHNPTWSIDDYRCVKTGAGNDYVPV